MNDRASVGIVSGCAWSARATRARRRREYWGRWRTESTSRNENEPIVLVWLVARQKQNVPANGQRAVAVRTRSYSATTPRPRSPPGSSGLRKSKRPTTSFPLYPFQSRGLLRATQSRSLHRSLLTNTLRDRAIHLHANPLR
jgi:hypothetical protein